jgi:hypothetical protein
MYPSLARDSAQSQFPVYIMFIPAAVAEFSQGLIQPPFV